MADGRLGLAADTSRYDLLVIDAFSSDAIPVHLLTREALVDGAIPGRDGTTDGEPTSTPAPASGVAVMGGYYYFRRAQRRDAHSTSEQEPPAVE